MLHFNFIPILFLVMANEIKISWALLTFNRASTVEKAITQNMATAQYEWDEMVWVDNGSTEDNRCAINKVVSCSPSLTKVLNYKNLGVDVGYNRAIALSKSDWILITGCDRLMFDGWLSKIAKILSENPNVKVLSIYSNHIEKLPERVRGPIFEMSGYKVCKAMPFGARIFHRDLLKKAGYFREDFGLYGYSDIEFAERQMRVCDENGWEYLAFTDEYAKHLGDEGCKSFNGYDPKSYWEFKQKELKDPKKQEVLNWSKKNKYPYYSPY